MLQNAALHHAVPAQPSMPHRISKVPKTRLSAPIAHHSLNLHGLSLPTFSKSILSPVTQEIPQLLPLAHPMLAIRVTGSFCCQQGGHAARVQAKKPSHNRPAWARQAALQQAATGGLVAGGCGPMGRYLVWVAAALLAEPAMLRLNLP